MKKLFPSKVKKESFAPGNNSILSPIVATKLHLSCKTLSIHSFIQAHCNNDLSGLIITGEPSQIQLQQAWNEILFEYSSLIKNEESDYIHDLEKQISILQWHINYVDNAVLLLRLRYDEDIATELRGLGYEVLSLFDYDPESDYQMALNMVISLCKRVVFDLDDITDEYDRLYNTAGGKKQTEEDFEKTIAMLSKFQSYHIDSLTTSVFRFTVIFNNYLSYMKVRSKVNAE